jgi:antitoxin (DNA-binding transcriptional repressor) of toxin-antitoxin stability system
MTKATIEELAKDINGYVSAAQKEQVIVIRDGRPCALLVGMENRDAEDFHYMTSPEFWRMIEEARRMPTVPLEQVKAQLFGDKNSPSGQDNKESNEKQ